jgi:pimeloyl-ACP methyl ester carboxylesterase
LGGKVALALLRRHPASIRDVFLLDSNPGAMPAPDATVELVLGVLSSLPFPFPTQQAFWEAAVGGGLSSMLARWLGMSLERRADGYHFGPSLSAIRELYEDYLRQDLWPVLESVPAEVRVGVLLGGRSPSFAELQPRFEALAQARPNVRLAVLPHAGHWVHVDDPEGTFAFVSEALGRPGG